MYSFYYREIYQTISHDILTRDVVNFVLCRACSSVLIARNDKHFIVGDLMHCVLKVCIESIFHGVVGVKSRDKVVIVPFRQIRVSRAEIGI